MEDTAKYQVDSPDKLEIRRLTYCNEELTLMCQDKDKRIQELEEALKAIDTCNDHTSDLRDSISEIVKIVLGTP